MSSSYALSNFRFLFAHSRNPVGERGHDIAVIAKAGGGDLRVHSGFVGEVRYVEATAAARRNHWHFADGTVHRCNWRIVAGSINGSLGTCLHDLGICAVPEWMARPYIDRGELVHVLERYPLREVPIVLLYPRIRHQSVITKVLLEALRSSVAHGLSASAHPGEKR